MQVDMHTSPIPEKKTKKQENNCCGDVKPNHSKKRLPKI
jgi:hypothetical protein